MSAYDHFCTLNIFVLLELYRYELLDLYQLGLMLILLSICFIEILLNKRCFNSKLNYEMQFFYQLIFISLFRNSLFCHCFVMRFPYTNEHLYIHSQYMVVQERHHRLIRQRTKKLFNFMILRKLLIMKILDHYMLVT